MSHIDEKKAAARRLHSARRTIERSESLPANLKAFLSLFLGYTSSTTSYEVVWASQPTLGRKLGYAITGDTCRSVQRMIAILRKCGAIEVNSMGTTQAATWFFTRYGFTFGRRQSLPDKHRQNFYRICWDHQLWKQGQIDGLDHLLKDVTGKASRGANPDTGVRVRDSLGRWQKTSNHDTENPRTTTPVSGLNHDTGVRGEKDVLFVDETALEQHVHQTQNPTPHPTVSDSEADNSSGSSGSIQARRDGEPGSQPLTDGQSPNAARPEPPLFEVASPKGSKSSHAREREQAQEVPARLSLTEKIRQQEELLEARRSAARLKHRDARLLSLADEVARREAAAADEAAKLAERVGWRGSKLMWEAR